MSDAAALPAKLAEVVADFQFVDRSMRADMLIEYADRFVEVPANVAVRPFPETNRAPRCESDAFVFPVDQPDGTLHFYFAIENPQGLSAKAWATVLEESCSGVPLEQVAQVPQETIFELFGRDLSMGKGQGLIGMLDLVQYAAKQRLITRRMREQGL
ncbi:MAG: SufE family protein [Candidatus Eisenbacteria bacterium]